MKPLLPLAFVLFSSAFCAQASRAQNNPAVSPSASVMGTASTYRAMLERALDLRGIPYRFGGSSPDSGFDCSGLVRYLFREAFGLMVGQRAEDIARLGEPVNNAELRPGDLVFYNTLRRSFSHVGIYLGGREFLHAPASGGVVRIEKMDQSYWTRRFEGARRVVVNEGATVTLSGGLPDTAHGSDVLLGDAGGASFQEGSTSPGENVPTLRESPAATRTGSTIIRSRQGSKPSSRSAESKTETRADSLDRFIEKLKEK